MQTEKCPECGSFELVCSMSTGETHCKNCGLIVEDVKLEQANYISESIKSVATNPYLIKAGSKGQQGKIYKDTWLLSTKEKNIRFGNRKIDSLAEKLSIPKYVKTEAKTIFKTAMDKDLAVGRDRLSIIFASVYTACIVHGIPKTPLEVIVNSSVEKKNLLRAYKLIKKNLGIIVTPIEPIDLIPRFASKLNLSAGTVTKANELAMKIKNTSIVYGRRPETIVASILYVASKKNGEPKTQRDVANAVGVIEVTIRKISKDIVEQLNLIF